MNNYKLSWKAFGLAVIGGVVGWYLSDSIPLGVAVFTGFLMPSWGKIYMEYAADNPQGYWFKRKLYGWGWTPVRWQGWLAIAIYAGLIAGLAVRANNAAVIGESFSLAFFPPFVVATTIFLLVAYKTGEKPGWQWGVRN